MGNNTLPVWGAWPCPHCPCSSKHTTCLPTPVPYSQGTYLGFGSLPMWMLPPAAMRSLWAYMCAFTSEAYGCMPRSWHPCLDPCIGLLSKCPQGLRFGLLSLSI